MKKTAAPLIVRSLNEIQSQTLKAARGAGWEWGLAEEWGYAARWLAARRLPIFLAELLHQPALPPAAANNTLRPSEAGGFLCPLRTGVYLSDNIARFAAGVTIENIRAPLWLLPFVARLGTVKATWLDIAITVSETAIWLPQPPAAGSAFDTALTAEISAEVSLLPATPPANGGISAADDGCALDEEEWQRLEASAKKNLVPATALSRDRGAGAGGSDDN